MLLLQQEANFLAATQDVAGSLTLQIWQNYRVRATSLETVPNGANMGLSCGNPLAIAALQEGQTVLDLGNGGGLCCQSFHFYTKVGDS